MMNNETYPNFKQFLLLLIFFFSSLFCLHMIFAISHVIGGQLSDSYMVFIIPVVHSIFYILFILYVSRKSGIPVRWTVKLPPIYFVLLLSLLAISTVIITQPFIYPIEYFSSLGEGRFRFVEFVMPKFNLLVVYRFIFTVFIVPVCEEIFWRKQVFGILLKKYSPTMAIVLSSVLFACGHLRRFDIGSLFIWGLLFCFVYYKSKSIEFSILLHSISNVHSFFVKRVFIDINQIQFFKYITIIIISALVFYMVISYLNRNKLIKDYEIDNKIV